MITVSVDSSSVRRALQGAGKQAPFAIAKALTHVAKDASTAVTASMPAKFDRPNPFTQKAMAIKPATKANLESQVFVKDAQAKYLALQETGGQRAPKPGSPINIAVNQRVNQYGNLPRGALARLRNRKDTFASKGGTGKLPAGLYQHVKGSVKMLVAFEKRADYKPRFGMQDTVKRSVHSGFRQRLEASLNAALASAR